MLSEYFWFQYTFQYLLSAIFLPVNSCKRCWYRYCWWQILSIFFNSFTCILVILFSQSSLWRGLAQCFDFSNLVFLWTKTSSADLPSRHLLQEFHEVPRCFSVCVKHSQHVSDQWKIPRAYQSKFWSLDRLNMFLSPHSSNILFFWYLTWFDNADFFGATKG